MSSLKKMSITEIKSIYDFLEIRKNFVVTNPEHFEENELHEILNKQKMAWQVLNNRINDIIELKDL